MITGWTSVPFLTGSEPTLPSKVTEFKAENISITKHIILKAASYNIYLNT